MSNPLTRRLDEIEARAHKVAMNTWRDSDTCDAHEDIAWLVARLRAALLIVEHVRDSDHTWIDDELARKLAAFDALAAEET